MNLVEFKKILVSKRYKMPKTDYSFIRQIVINIGGVDMGITPRLNYDQYKMYLKLTKRYL